MNARAPKPKRDPLLGTRVRRPVGRPRESGPHPVDVHVGKRVRLRRTLMGLSQEKLGELIQLTFQQVQKYERGANRISASKLFTLSQVLDVPVSFFFDDMPEKAAAAVAVLDEDDGNVGEYEPDPMAKRETLELVRAYYRIPCAALRKRLFDLTKAVAGMPATAQSEDDGDDLL